MTKFDSQSESDPEVVDEVELAVLDDVLEPLH